MPLKILIFLPWLALPSCSSVSGWKTADRASAGLAPLPEEYKPAVIQIYKAPLWGLRGLIADHTWTAVKREGADSYNVYEVLGWLQFKNEKASVLRVSEDIPDRLWFGKRPERLVDLRGDRAGKLIDKIHQAAVEYPYKKEYSMLLGPNSNTFTAWIACRVPELNLDLSSRAVGKNYLKSCP